MIEFILLIVLLFIGAVTAASETSMIAMRRFKLRRLAAAGSKTAKLILKILETPERFFGTLVVTNNIVNALLASVITAIIITIIGKSTGRGVLFATVIASFLIIVSEVVAKTLAAKHSERFSMFLAAPVQALIIVLSPVVKIFEVIVNVLVRAIGGEVKGKAALVTDEEMKFLIKTSEEETLLHKEKYKMLSKVFDFSEAVVKSVMTPKKDIVSIDITANFDDILSKVIESGYSRLPVYKDNSDNIIGIINMKDMLSLTCNRELIVLQDMVYPAISVPETKKVTELLKEFQKGHTHIAIVADTHGKPVGLVTLEDLLEEIVGEIKDEYDIRGKE